MCPNRVYVQAGVYERIGAMLAEQVSALKVAPAIDADALIGPVINACAVDKIGREGSKYGLDDYLSIKYLCQGGLS